MNSPAFVGHLDAIENGQVYGWALNVRSPLEPVMVSIEVNGISEAQIIAGYHRPDVAQALACSGRNGFYFDLDSIKTGRRSMRINVRFPDGTPLEGGPLFYQASQRSSVTPKPTVLFLHIPKTAGTSFREAMVRNYKESEVVYVYGDPPGFPIGNLRELPQAQIGRTRLLCGHYGIGAHRFFSTECKYAALIRDPVQRLWSHYSHFVRDGSPVVVRNGNTLSLENLLEERATVPMDNLYVRYFCDIEESQLPAGAVNRDVFERAWKNIHEPNVFLRMQDDLDGAYDSLAAEFGWMPGVKCPRVNLSPKSSRLPNANEMSAMRHFNSWDFKLFDRMAELASVRGPVARQLRA